MSSPSDRSMEGTCESCRLNCRSIHGPVTQPCYVENCYSCADLKVVDDEILAAYKHLSTLVQKRMQIVEKHHDKPFIQRLPIEIFSLIFVFLKDESIGRANTSDSKFGVPWFKAPTQLPPLLVSSVCKRWREVALDMPMLWTDIAVDLMKSGESQLWLVNEWARRSSPLSFNLAVFMAGSDVLDEEALLEDFKDVVGALRSLALRWNNLVLRVPWSFCHGLLNGLEESLNIRSMFYVQDDRFQFEGVDPVKLHPPLCPRHFFCHYFLPPSAISFEWSSLVHLEFSAVYTVDLLRVIWNAPNLIRCVAKKSIYSSSDQELSILPRYITSHSLMHLEANLCILDRLTLPSLQTLEYIFWDAPGTDPFVEFINRSLPPLQTLHLESDHHWNPQLTSCFGKLSAMIHLSIRLDKYDTGVDDLLQTLTNSSSDNAQILFPRLQELEFILPSMSAASWTLLSDLFEQDTQSDTSGVEGTMTFSPAFKRPLSKLTVVLQDDDFDVDMDEETFRRLLAIKHSGVKLHLEDGGQLPLLDQIAEHYVLI